MLLAPVVTDRTDVIGVEPDRLWEVLEDVAAYPSFWPWLQSFDGRRLRGREEWHGLIAAGGPLRLRVTIHVSFLQPGRWVSAHVTGDLMGVAKVDLARHPDGTALHLGAKLYPRRRALRVLTRVARPLAQASHDRVIDRAVAQLIAHVEH